MSAIRQSTMFFRHSINFYRCISTFDKRSSRSKEYSTDKMRSIYVFVSIILAVIMADKCVVYEEGEELPPEPVGERECFQVMGDSKRYCIDFDCPTPECSNPITPENGCPFCNGTWINGGKVFKVGESFKCADRCNYCSYTEHGFSQTLMGCLFMEPPKECQT